ncbi:SDR family NAD(P)-dependent oxidoreductase [Micromonospora sp. NPDC006766]|uniref:SDR family NAD(P)-dependent oxidoreductase n=1 Tax=Micromonospora sp. NPDC006766 TaxID=3154778 RepID=UPI0033FCC3FB
MRGLTVLVTGASSGIGAATAVEAGRLGATVIAVARRADLLDGVVGRINASAGMAASYPCDLTQPDRVAAMVELILQRHQTVDVLVNNAGRSIRRSIPASWNRIHDFERTMAINYLAPVRLTMALLPHMVAAGSGHIVNVTTAGVQLRTPKFAAYISSKTALDTFGRIVAREMRADGITVSNVRMPLVRTDMIAPTEMFANVPALLPADAARIVIRAAEDRPISINRVGPTLFELLSIAAPKLAETMSHRSSRRLPDSRAATASSSGSELR